MKYPIGITTAKLSPLLKHLSNTKSWFVDCSEFLQIEVMYYYSLVFGIAIQQALSTVR